MCNLTKNPFASFQSSINSIFLLLVCLLEEENADYDPARDNDSAHKVRQEIRIFLPNGTRLEQVGIVENGPCQCASKSRS